MSVACVGDGVYFRGWGTSLLTGSDVLGMRVRQKSYRRALLDFLSVGRPVEKAVYHGTFVTLYLDEGARWYLAPCPRNARYLAGRCRELEVTASVAPLFDLLAFMYS